MSTGGSCPGCRDAMTPAWTHRRGTGEPPEDTEDRRPRPLELKPEGPQLIDGFLTGSSTLRNEQDEESLAEVIRRINAEYGANLSTSDQILIGQVVAAVAEIPSLPPSRSSRTRRLLAVNSPRIWTG